VHVTVELGRAGEGGDRVGPAPYFSRCAGGSRVTGRTIHGAVLLYESRTLELAVRCERWGGRRGGFGALLLRSATGSRLHSWEAQVGAGVAGWQGFYPEAPRRRRRLLAPLETGRCSSANKTSRTKGGDGIEVGPEIREVGAGGDRVRKHQTGGRRRRGARQLNVNRSIRSGNKDVVLFFSTRSTTSLGSPAARFRHDGACRD